MSTPLTIPVVLDGRCWLGYAHAFGVIFLAQFWPDAAGDYYFLAHGGDDRQYTVGKPAKPAAELAASLDTLSRVVWERLGVGLDEFIWIDVPEDKLTFRPDLPDDES